jgi:hypothetical protein
MYRRSWFFVRLFGVLLLVGVLLAVGALAFQAGQAQGYAMGLAMSGEELAVPPAGLTGYPFWGRPYVGFAPMGPFLGLLCLGGLGLAFLFALGAIFRPRHWHRHPGPGQPGDPYTDDWHAQWHASHGGPPPWVKEKETPPPAPNPVEPPAASGSPQSSTEAG